MTSTTEALRKITLFKGTVLVSFVYAIISVVLLVTIYFTKIGAEFTQETNFPFAITFTIGMLVIIGILIYKVSTFKEDEQNVVKLYDDMTCPEFWTLAKTDSATLDDFSNETKGYMRYKCVKPTDAPANTNIKIDTAASGISDADKQLAAAERIMHNETGNEVNVNCGELYPKYMSSVDVRENPGPQNSMRCAYVNRCGLTWSSVCPDQ
jgi:hypothetical protein